MSDRGAERRRPEIRLTPPPRITSVGGRSHRGWLRAAVVVAALMAGAAAVFVVGQSGLLSALGPGTEVAPGGDGARPSDGDDVGSPDGNSPAAELAGADDEAASGGDESLAPSRRVSPGSPAGRGDRSEESVDATARRTGRAPSATSAQTVLFSSENRAAPTASGEPETEFGIAMAEGLAAVERGDWEAARTAFERAAAIRPDSPEPAAGLARLEAATSRMAIEEQLTRARDLAASEEWHQAAAAYRTALEVDPTLTAVRDGLRIAEARSLLFDRLAHHIDNPGRLAADAVLAEAERLLDSARGVADAGPRHREQIARLAELVGEMRTPVRIALVSDALTEVTVYQVGRLGAFSRHELELRPGTYTVVGSRTGYRDVRRQLTVEPGGLREPFEIRCEERI